MKVLCTFIILFFFFSLLSAQPNIIAETHQRYFPDRSLWINDLKTFYDYDLESEKLSNKKTFKWQENIWNIYTSEEYFYKRGILLKQVFKGFQNDDFVTVDSMIWNLDENDNPIEIIRYDHWNEQQSDIFRQA